MGMSHNDFGSFIVCQVDVRVRRRGSARNPLYALRRDNRVR